MTEPSSAARRLARWKSEAHQDLVALPPCGRVGIGLALPRASAPILSRA
jgi:hypothetical protein